MLSILRKSELARTNNFDLLQAEGWATLQEDIAEDFPYLTLQELNHIIKRGYKGELDKYKSLSLNFPRVYQWVKAEAPKQLSYWHRYFSEAMRFAQLMGLEADVMGYIRSQSGQVNDSLLRTNIKQHIERKFYQPFATQPQPAGAEHPRHAILHDQYATWAAEYPTYAQRHAPTIF